MSGLGRVIRSGVRRRRVQTVVIGLVSAAAVTASVLGAGLLVASWSPFDAGFTAQHGAHLSVLADPRLVTQAQLTASKTAPGVTDAAGPYPVLTLSFTGAGAPAEPPAPAPGSDGGVERPEPAPDAGPIQLTLVGRAEPGGDVDRVELVDGRWPTGRTRSWSGAARSASRSAYGWGHPADRRSRSSAPPGRSAPPRRPGCCPRPSTR